jgi:hypothetical protein
MKLAIYRSILSGVVLSFSTMVGYGQHLFAPQIVSSIPKQQVQTPQPSNFSVYKADHAALWQFLNAIPTSISAHNIIRLPTPEGGEEAFVIWYTPCMEQGLIDKYSNIKTFSAYQANNKRVTAKIDITVQGFHAMVYNGAHTYLIDPYAPSIEAGYYWSYYKKDFPKSLDNAFYCEQNTVLDIPDADGQLPEQLNANGSTEGQGNKEFGGEKKTYRLALSCTGEYAQAVGGTTPTTASVLSAMVTTMNRVNGIYEREFAVSLNLIANNDLLIYLNPGSDPFTANNNGNMLLGHSIIGAAGYDIGHIFSTGGGGIAAIRSVCNNAMKARGVTGSNNPVGDPFDVDYVAHEMGHQFGANHSFNACTSYGNDDTAYEPGSGSTIMAYAGLSFCGVANVLQNNSDDYFHTTNLNEITNFIQTGNGNSCAAVSPVSVSVPLIASMAGLTYYIPTNTAFELTAAAATAPNSDGITYCWEQFDLGGIDYGEDENLSATFTQGPLFRSWAPQNTTTRVFPKIESVINNSYWLTGERIPTVTRSMRFRLTARNLYQGIGAFNNFTNTQLTTLQVIKTDSIFAVQYPNNSGIEVSKASSMNVTWEVANTNITPINTTGVDIYLSTDGGYTYPYTLATAVPNTGSATVTLPDNVFSDQARIKVKGANNVFFDISNNNFKIKDTTTAIQDLEQQLGTSIQIYPNPAQQVLTIDALQDSPLQVSMFNVLGQQVFTKTFNKTMVIPVNTWARGAYFIAIMDVKTGAKSIKKVVLD